MKNRHVSVSELTRVVSKLTRVGYLSDTLPSGVYSRQFNAEVLLQIRFRVDFLSEEICTELLIEVPDAVTEEREREPVVHRCEHSDVRAVGMALPILLALPTIHLDHVRMFLELQQTLAT